MKTWLVHSTLRAGRQGQPGGGSVESGAVKGLEEGGLMQVETSQEGVKPQERQGCSQGASRSREGVEAAAILLFSCLAVSQPGLC